MSFTRKRDQRKLWRIYLGYTKSNIQPAGQTGTISARSDSAVQKSKKPQTEIAKQQVVSQAGDTVAIVFCKRVNDIGGTWVQPPLVKTGSVNFVGQFLYAISQGEMGSSPNSLYSWVGENNVKFLPNTASITLTHYYSSAATMAASPNSCPITSGTLFCDLNTYSYLQPLQGASGFVEREPDYTSFYSVTTVVTRGFGDTSNSVINIPNASIGIYENETGADVTSLYWDYYDIDPDTTSTLLNPLLDPVTSVIIGGREVGDIIRLPSSGWAAPDPDYFSEWGASGPVTYVYGSGTVNDQINEQYPESTGTLLGVQTEIQLSIYANPASPPSSADYTTFADITFLQITGNIYDPPDSGSYPTTTRQLSIFYENGVQVSLYSGGLVSGVYPVGSSNQFVDLAMYLFALMDRANNDQYSAPISTANLQALASFCSNYELYFNGIIEQSVNVIDYISKISPYFFLAFISANGQYRLLPLLPLNGSNQIDLTGLTPAMTFSELNIMPGSFQKQYFDAGERQPFNVSLVWREADPTAIGIQRTTNVRYATTDANATVQQYDMTDFCVTSEHAAMYGKYELARRKFSSHAISFSTPLLTTELLPTQIIKIERQRITSDGDNRAETEWYQVDEVRHSSTGVTNIAATHFPVDESNIAKISNEVVNGSFEVT